MFSHSQQVASLEQAQTDLRLGILNLDMIRELRKTPAPQKAHLKRTFGQLKKALQEHNAKFGYPQSQISRCSYEMSRKGADIERLEKDIAVRRTERYKQQQTKKQVEDCYFYIPKLTLSNVKECLDKVLEYNIFNSIQQTMVIGDFPRQLKKEFMKRRRGIVSDPMGSRRQANFVSNLRSTLPTRNEVNQKKYIKIVNEYILSGYKITPMQLSRMFFGQTNSLLWGVLVRQFENLEPSKMSKLDITRTVLKSSITMIEQDNSMALPNQSYAVESHVKSEILARPEVKRNFIYYQPRTNRPYWAIIYTLLKAGRNEQILRMDEKPFFLEDFKYYLYGENRRQRYVYRGDRNQSDIFLDMLYSILNRNPMAQECLITVSKDLLWFGLKTMDLDGSQPSESFTLEELQRLIVERHDKEMSSSSVLNLIHCMAYDEVLKQGNDLVDIDDSMHLFILLCLLKFPQRDLLNKSREEFVGALLIYAQDLAPFGIQNCLNYFLLAYDPNHPQTKREVFELVEKFITERNFVEQFFGSFPRPDTKPQQQLQKIMGPCAEEFARLVDNVAVMYRKKYSKYVYPAMLYNNLLKQPQKSLDCLITMKLESLIEDKVIDEGEKKDAAKLVDKFVKEGKQSKEQELLLKFMNSYQSLCNSLQHRTKLSYQLANNPCVPRTDYIDNETLGILNALNARGAIKLYLMFFELVVKAIEIECSYRPDKHFYRTKINQLGNFNKKMTQNSVVDSNSPALRSLLGKIHDLLSKPAIAF